MATEKIRRFLRSGSPKKTGPQQWEKSKLDDDSTMVGGRLDDVIIPIMGATGAGKSTFINQLLGKKVMGTSDGLKSCTKKPQYHVVDVLETPLGWKYAEFGSRRIVLLDTPGFNDSDLDDHEILRRISIWLAHSYNDKLTVAGVIFLHDISTSRMTPIGRQNIALFQGLCGSKALSRVILGQTYWERLSEAQLSARNTDLKTKYWKDLLDHHATVVKIGKPEDCATWAPNIDYWGPIDLLLDEALNKQSPVLRIQKELVDLDKRLEATAAAGAIRQHLQIAIRENENLLQRDTSEEEQMRYMKQNDELVRQIQQLQTKIPLSLRFRSFFNV